MGFYEHCLSVFRVADPSRRHSERVSFTGSYQRN